MGIHRTIIEKPAPAVLPRRLKDLTLGQVIALLEARGGPVARQAVAALLEGVPQSFRRSPEDFCTLAMLGLVTVSRAGAAVTSKGGAMLHKICGD